MMALVAAGSGVVTLTAAAIGATALRHCVVRVTVIGRSMTPTLLDGQTVVAARRHRYRVGDVVVFDVRGLAAAAPPYRVKRIAAVSGEPRPHWMTGGASIVPAGTVAVQGDNTNASQDSRQLGYVPLDAVLGRVLSLPGLSLRYGAPRVSLVEIRSGARVGRL